jgi:hypothetical protein
VLGVVVLLELGLQVGLERGLADGTLYDGEHMRPDQKEEVRIWARKGTAGFGRQPFKVVSTRVSSTPQRSLGNLEESGTRLGVRRESSEGGRT